MVNGSWLGGRDEKKMKQYLELCKHILEHGQKKEDRTGIGTISVFGYQSKYDLRDGFPILTTKKILFSAVVYELLWFLKGSTNINDGLKAHTPIWNAWANEAGELGPVYGYQWRKWEKFVEDPKTHQYRPDAGTPSSSEEERKASQSGLRPEGFHKEHVDQISQVIEQIKKNPNSRRLIVSAWNVADLDRMALPPCHAFFQFYVVGGRLDCQLYQRSADVALGVPFNIASYALLMSMVAKECHLKPGIFVHTLGDAHIYLNHLEGIKTQLARTSKPLPQLKLADKKVLEFKFEDIELVNYQHEPFIKFSIAV